MYAYTPTYYTTFQDSISSLCKSILPFSFKKRRLPAIAAAEQRLSKQQSDNLKWQQDSFHQILNLMGLCKEGILNEAEVSAFRAHLLETLIASPPDHEQPMILRDKLIFLQDLLYAKCISEEEYHSSKRPLLQRLAVQGAEIEATDVIVGVQKAASDEEWSVIDLKDEHCLPSKERKKSKQDSAMKQIKGVASVFSFVSSHRNGKAKGEASTDICGKPLVSNDEKEENFPSFTPRNELGLSRENPFWNIHLNEKESGSSRSILMSESLPTKSLGIEIQSGDHSKRKPNDHDADVEGGSKLVKKQWVFDGFKKWKKNSNSEDRTTLSSNKKADNRAVLGELSEKPVEETPVNKQIKRKMHSSGSPSDVYKVLGQNVKRELCQIQAELNARNPNVHFSDDQIEAISIRLPVDRADLKKFFPKPWCDRYGDVVLDVVRKEFEGQIGEMGRNMQTTAAKQENISKNRWTTTEHDENYHPNLFATQSQSILTNHTDEKCFRYNPFFDN